MQLSKPFFSKKMGRARTPGSLVKRQSVLVGGSSKDLGEQSKGPTFHNSRAWFIGLDLYSIKPTRKYEMTLNEKGLPHWLSG